MNQNDPPTEHILACLSSSPSNAKIVRTAATMAKAFGGTFTALYVRTPDSDQMGNTSGSMRIFPKPAYFHPGTAAYPA